MSRLCLLVLIFLTSSIISIAQDSFPFVCPRCATRLSSEFFVIMQFRPDETTFETKRALGDDGLKIGKNYLWKNKDLSLSVSAFEYAQSKKTDEELRTHLGKGAAAVRFIYGSDGLKPLGITYPSNECIQDSFSSELAGETNLHRIIACPTRLYRITATFRAAEHRETALKAILNFRHYRPDEIAEINLKTLMPDGLPQQPVIKKARSDAENRGLKGTVSSVHEWEEYDWGKRGLIKRIVRTMYFERDGRLLKEIRYASNLPSTAILYGFVDGFRVSRMVYVGNDRDFWKLPAGAVDAAPLYDARYESEYDKEGRLTMTLYDPKEESEWIRSFFSYSGNTVVEKHFDRSQLPVASVVTKTLDDKGNVVESVRKSKTATFTNIYEYKEFDSHGNWTRREKTEKTSRDGDTITQPAGTECRRIEYYK